MVEYARVPDRLVVDWCRGAGSAHTGIVPGRMRGIARICPVTSGRKDCPSTPAQFLRCSSAAPAGPMPNQSTRDPCVRIGRP
jgi:hypothetical protein